MGDNGGNAANRDTVENSIDGVEMECDVDVEKDIMINDVGEGACCVVGSKGIVEATGGAIVAGGVNGQQTVVDRLGEGVDVEVTVGESSIATAGNGVSCIGSDRQGVPEAAREGASSGGLQHGAHGMESNGVISRSTGGAGVAGDVSVRKGEDNPPGSIAKHGGISRVVAGGGASGNGIDSGRLDGAHVGVTGGCIARAGGWSGICH